MQVPACVGANRARPHCRCVSVGATRRAVLGSAAVAGATLVDGARASATAEPPLVGKRSLAPGTQISEVRQGIALLCL